MDEFKTIERLKEATAEEIAAAIKVPAAVAEDICEYVQHYE